MMNYKRLNLTLILFMIGLFVALPLNTQAEGQLGSTHEQKVTIVKYGLNENSQGFSQEQTTNNGLQINNIPTDDHGNELSPLANISYSIQKVEPTGDANQVSVEDKNTYHLDGEAVIITTDQTGQATITLQDGLYIVSEQANPSAGLKVAAKPLLYRLPVLNETQDGYLSQVYIYPKSSIDTLETTPPSSTPVHSTSPSSAPKNETPKKTPGIVQAVKDALPKTNAESGLKLSILGLSIILGVGVSYWLFNKRRKSDREEKFNEN